MKGLLLINLGTPASPKTKDVRRYLREFLMDGRVIDIPWFPRFLLVQGIIAPFRAPKSAEAYAKIWDAQKGSPLLSISRQLLEKVKSKLAGTHHVVLAMNYGNPSITDALEELRQKNVSHIDVLPLYPQYAVSSTGSAIAKVYTEANKHWHTPPIRVLPAFFDHPLFIQSWKEVLEERLKKMNPDLVFFSFHGLPERQIQKTDMSAQHCLQSENCCDTMTSANAYCYRAQCYATAKKIVQALDLKTPYLVTFQSRLGRTPWIRPYTDILLTEHVQKGAKRIAVVCPAFVADCLETLEEIGIRAREQALSLGAETLELMPSLNDHPRFVDMISDMTVAPTLPFPI